MSNPNKKENQQDLEALLVTATANGGPQQGANSALTALADRIIKRYDKEDREAETRAQEQANYRAQQLESVSRAMDQRHSAQNSCTHMKPNYTSALNGQRDHNQDLHLVCSYCGKEVDQKELAANPVFRFHKIAGDRIGGPIN